jgi:hypothetical protein
MCNVFPFLLRRPAVYEVALSSGIFFALGGAYLFISALHDIGHRWRRLAGASLFCGLAVGCRPTHVFGGVLVIVAASTLAWTRKSSSRSRMLQLVSVLVPFGLCALALGLYNFARFDSWTEFGLSYQLAGLDPRKLLSATKLSNVIPALNNYLFAPSTLTSKFPFWHFGRGQQVTEFANEVVVGLYSFNPMLLLPTVLLPFVLRDVKRVADRRLGICRSSRRDALRVGCNVGFGNTWVL